MPVSFVFENNGRGVVVTAVGEILDGELSSVSKSVYCSEVLSKLKYQIIDLTNVDSVNTTPEQIQLLAARNIAAAKESEGLAMAVIVSNGLMESLVRLWRFYAQDEMLQVSVFKDRMSATNWLETLDAEVS